MREGIRSKEQCCSGTQGVSSFTYFSLLAELLKGPGSEFIGFWVPFLCLFKNQNLVTIRNHQYFFGTKLKIYLSRL